MTKAERFNQLIGAGKEADELGARSVRGGLFNVAAEAGDFLLRVISIAILARLLVPEHFGLIAMVTAITAIAERFKDLGLSVVTVQRDHISHEQVSTLFWVNAALGLVSGAIVAGLAVPIAAFYGDDRLVYITAAIALTFVWGGLTIQHQAILRRTMKFGRIASVHISASLGSIIVAIVLAYYGFGFWALVAREVARSIFLAVGTWACCPWIPGLPSRGTDARAMVGFGGSVTIVQLLTHFSSNFGIIVIGRMFGANILGYYRQGLQLVFGPISQLIYPVYTVSEVALSRLQSRHEQYRQYYYKVLMLLCTAAMPIAAFVVVHAEAIVQVMLGDAWLEAVPFFRILGIAAFLSPANATIGIVSVTCGHSRRYLWVGLVSSIALIAFSLAGLKWGAIGVASAHIIATYGLLIPRAYWSFINTPVSVGGFMSAMTRPAIASAVMAIVLQLVHETAYITGSLATLLSATVLGAAVYAATWIVIPGGWAEARWIVSGVMDSVTPKTGSQPA